MTKSWSICTDQVTSLPDYELIIKQPLFSKARPRLTRSGHAYMPPAYKAAQAEMRKQLKAQWKEGPLEGPVAISLVIYGEGRGDADNIAGAFLDAAQGIVLSDDRVSVVPKLSVEWHKASRAESKWVISIFRMGCAL